jgi:hypothetical protein
MSNSNLPPTQQNKDSSDEVRLFFDRYFVESISFPAEQIDAVVGFFKKRNFDDVAANSTALVLLQQAKLDNVNPFDLLDTLTGLTEVQLSAIVAEVLNYNRQKNSTLGYRKDDPSQLSESRNILV